MMKRRDALKTITLSTAAVWAGSFAHAQTNSPVSPGADPFVLPPLPFAPDALEPHIDTRTMEIHHGKHHAAYVNNLNKALAAYPVLAKLSIEDLMRNVEQMPSDIMTSVRNNGGGHANHSLFWKCLSPQGGGRPEGDLMESLTATFGSFEAFQEQLTKAALGVFGSGWAWLSLDAEDKLSIESLPNQDSPLMFGRRPLFGIDVWEHAYYLHYQNRRADYVKAVWNVVDWQYISARYTELVEF